MPIGRAMQRARKAKKLVLAVVGGSTAAGGGTMHCDASTTPCAPMRRCCGPSFPKHVAEWLHASQGIKVELLNRAVGATGSDYAALCLGTLFEGAAASSIDIILVEYAINAMPDFCVRDTDKLLWRLRKLAPRAAILFVHTFAAGTFLDRSEGCLNPLARFYALSVVSWKHAALPLLSAKQAAPLDLLEPPLMHHPNAEGHRHLASIVAHFLLSAESKLALRQASKADPPDGEGERLLPVVRDRDEVTFRTSSLSGADWMRQSLVDFSLHAQILAEPLPQCLWAGTPNLKHTSNALWREPGPSAPPWYASGAPMADLVFTVSCARDCFLKAGLSKSYQPLGTLDVYVDGVLALGNHSQAYPPWRALNWMITVNSFVSLQLPSSRGLGPGPHTVAFRSRGETIPAAQAWPSNYEKHEVHVRGLAICSALDMLI